MRKHIVVVVALSSWVMATAGSARADEPPRSVSFGLETPSAWVLRVPLTLRLATPPTPPAVAFAPSPPNKRDDSGEYPDPRAMPLRRFYLESQLERDFTFAAVPLSSRMIAYEPNKSWQSLDALPAPMWQSDLVVRLPTDFYAGASLEQRTTAPRSVFVVAGERF